MNTTAVDANLAKYSKELCNIEMAIDDAVSNSETHAFVVMHGIADSSHDECEFDQMIKFITDYMRSLEYRVKFLDETGKMRISWKHCSSSVFSETEFHWENDVPDHAMHDFDNEEETSTRQLVRTFR